MTDPDCQESPAFAGAPAGGALFSDRAWALKLAAALALFAFFCWHARRKLVVLHPETSMLALDREDFRGRSMHTWARRVARADREGFDIETEVGLMHVAWSSAPPEPGQYVTLTGIVTGPRQIRGTGLQINSGYWWKRGINYGVSSLTVLAFLWLLRGRFRGSLSRGLLRSRY